MPEKQINKQVPATEQCGAQPFVCPLMQQAGPYMEDDEIDLMDLIKVVWKRKRLIIAIVILAGIGSVIGSLMLANIYRSEATIIPREVEKSGASAALSAFGGLGGMAGSILGIGNSGSLEKLEVVLKSRMLSRKIYETHKFDILAALYPDTWDPEGQKWLPDVEEPPTEQDVVKALSEMLTIKVPRDKRTLSVSFEHQDPAFAKKMVDLYLTALSEALRQETLQDATQNQKFLNAQLDQTSDVLLKEKIYALLAKEIEKETFARGQMPYSFQILDPPIVPDLDKKIKPRRSQICILSVVVAGMLGLFLAFLMEYITKLRKKNSNSDIPMPLT
jgi:uncharacterized protein involved in exopolysaccharide biosynthesis